MPKIRPTEIAANPSFVHPICGQIYRRLSEVSTTCCRQARDSNEIRWSTSIWFVEMNKQQMS